MVNGKTHPTLTGIYFQDKIFLEWGKVIATEKLTTNIFLTIRNLMKTYESWDKISPLARLSMKNPANFDGNFQILSLFTVKLVEI